MNEMKKYHLTYNLSGHNSIGFEFSVTFYQRLNKVFIRDFTERPGYQHQQL